MRTADELRDAVEAYLGSLTFAPSSAASRRRSATRSSRAASASAPCCASRWPRRTAPDEDALPAAAALELVHTFSLVHDDLPALDDDDERRGRPSAHVAFGEGVALLAGRRARSPRRSGSPSTYESPEIARELAEATLGMIGGQYRDITGDDGDLEELHRLKTGRLFVAAVRIGLDVARVPEERATAWIAFGEDVGLLFQVVDDLLDGDGYVERLGTEGARALADEVGRARRTPRRARADTSVLRDLVDALTFRTG